MSQIIKNGSGGVTPSNSFPNTSENSFYEDFLANTSGGAFSGVAISNVGLINGTATNPGILQFTSGTGGNNSLFFNEQSNVIDSPSSIVFGQNSIYLNWIIRLETLSNPTDDYTFYCGWGDYLSLSQGMTPVDGVFFTYTDGVNSGDFQVNSISSTTSNSTVFNTLIPMTTNFIKYGIALINGVATFYINGTLISSSSINTNIPVNPVCPFMFLTNTAGNTPVLDIDLCAFNIYLNPSR
jgi:hypothetical protein